MSTAKKNDIQEPEEDNEELEFDVQNDWRRDADKTQTSIFKEDDLEAPEDDLDTSTLILDIGGEVAKKSALEHAREQSRASRLARQKANTGGSDTLKSLQDSVDGAVSDDDEMEILNEEESALVNDPILSNKGDQYPQIHGNYFLLDHLVDGGMAKVCRARYLGEGDEADKMVAIKMVQEKFSSDDEFVQMFVDEIKVSFGLNHPNINTTFDYGKIGKNLFVSMEYIHGQDLMVVINELKKRKKTIPIPMAIYIASKMCEALHYAHNFTNKLTGQKYNIVHRDISPHNAMVSYEGYVKVIDFGIAKADTNTTEEAEGTIKGKVNYFAPEYLEGKKIDHRYDQFAVALTLWEMLTGEKTFKAPDQLLTLKTILECNPSLPSKHNKEVPKSLDQIVMKAMSKEPANRYKDMQAFNKELMKMLYQTYPDFHESDVSEMMKVLFKKSYAKDLEKFKEFGKYSISEIVQKINAFKDFQTRQKEKQQSSGKGKESMFDFGFTEESISARGKKGLDKLVTGKKKGRPGKDAEKNQKKRQRALAALLDNDDDFTKAEGILEQNKGKLIFIGIILLGYFQKELIKEIVFGSKNGVRGIISTSGQNVKGTEIKEIQKAGDKHAEAMKFVEELKKKQMAGENLQEKPKEKSKELKAEKQLKNEVKQRPSLVNKNIPTNKAIVPVSVDINKEAVKVLDSLKNSKKPKAMEEANQVTTTKAVAPIVNKGQEKPGLEPVEVKPVPVANIKAEELVDLQNVSIDDLKKRMEAQLAERREQISRPLEAKSEGTISGGGEGSKANIVNTETSPNTENVKAEVNSEAIRKEVSESAIKEEEVKVAPELASKTAQNPSNVTSPKKPLTQTEIELQELRDKMAKILEDRKKLEETPGIKKVNITLTEKEKKIAEEKSKAEIQRELASKLKEMDDDNSNKTDQGTQETTTDKVFKFIKSRRAFSWFFNE